MSIWTIVGAILGLQVAALIVAWALSRSADAGDRARPSRGETPQRVRAGIRDAETEDER